MCTVTYIPTANGAIISSNRDEKIQRAIALPPQQYSRNGFTLVYPKDPDASGTWITMQEQGQFAVLLNGAFQNHQPVYPYRKSRGLVLLDIAATRDSNLAFREIDLDNIEPFTLILFREGLLTVSRWDGHSKHLLTLNPNQPHIWSSSTLYAAGVVQQREAWFRDWLRQKNYPTVKDMLDFHYFDDGGNTQNGIRMNRKGVLLTVSITTIEIRPALATMLYSDLINNHQHQLDFRFVQEAHQLLT